MTLAVPHPHRTGSHQRSARLAGSLLAQHVRQVKRADVIANEATAPIREAWEDLIGIMAREPTNILKVQQQVRATLHRGMNQTQLRIDKSLRTIAEDAHGEAAETWLRVLPKDTWLALAEFKTGRRGSLLEFLEDSRQSRGFFRRLLDTAIDYGKLLLGKHLPKKEFDSLVKKTVFPPPSAQKVDSILYADYGPDRKSWKQRFAGKGYDIEQVVAQVSSGMVEGKNVAEITKQIEPLFTNPKYGIYTSAARIARTESIRVTQTMQRESWEPVQDLIIGGEIHNPLDERTRPEHRERAGTKYYKPGYGPPGAPSYSEMPLCPDQANCRCCNTPLILGVDE